VSAGQQVRKRGTRSLASVVAASAVVLIAATACGERSEPTGPSASLYPVTIANGDAHLAVTRPARRIAVIAPELAGILRALGVGSHLVGTPVATNGAIRLEELRALHADLVVASASSTGTRQISRAGAAARAKVYVASDASIRGVERTITELGLITNRSVEARRLIGRIEAKRSLVARKLRGVKPVTAFVDTGFFTTVTDQSLIGNLIREAGGRNVAGGDTAPGPFDLDRLVRLDPAVYLVTDGRTTLADLRKNRRARKLTAIREGRYRALDESLLVPGPRIGDGLVAVARALHPDAFR
jgi:iron complex transport system substrate-binding protein